MKYTIKPGNDSAYMQLYTQLRVDIINGSYEYGMKLPSKRLLAEESGCSVITVEHAYSILSDEGYIIPKERSGYFVIYKKDDFISVPEVSAKRQIINANAAKTDFPFSVYAKTVRRVLLDYENEILQKSPAAGCDILKEALVGYLSRSNGISVSKDRIIIGAGAEYLYGLLIKLLGSKRIYALENPSYEKIESVYKAEGVRFEKLLLGANGIKTDELKKTRASVLHVTPFNSFPSGVTADVSKRLEYLKWAYSRSGYIIEDNYDSELTVSKKNEDTLFTLTRDENVIYVNTFSKTVSSSVRVGYMILPEKLKNDFYEKLGFYSCTVPVLEQFVLAELINNGDFERHINSIRRLRRKEYKNTVSDN